MTKLEILQNSLEKKEALFTQKLDNHISTVKQANGQPLNDKRNGQATLNKWDKQNNALRTLNLEIEKTKEAIQDEQSTIYGVEKTKEFFPTPILELINQGILTQWRKHPTFLFIKGVDKARIIYDPKNNTIVCRYVNQVPKEQFPILKEVFNGLLVSLKQA